MPLKTGMPRDVDERKKRKALRKIRKAAMLAEQGLGPPLSDWERQFLEEVEERIEKFGSAFHDLEKGGADEALSSLQYVKLREIDKKARGKGKSGFKSKGGFKKKPAPRVREIDEDLEIEPVPVAPIKPTLVQAKDLPQPKASKSQKAPPKLRVITGGKEEE